MIFVSLLQGVPEQKLRGHLGSFGVTGNLALQPMYTLSGTLHYKDQSVSIISEIRYDLSLQPALGDMSGHIIIAQLMNHSVFCTTAYRLLMLRFLIWSVTGGQKSRVAFAKITFKKPHIILLDEPSNHLVSSCATLYAIKKGEVDIIALYLVYL